MSEAKYKKGPWRIKDDQVRGGAGLVIWSDCQGIVALMPSVIRDDGCRHGHMPDAALIAAAPDLILALESSIKALELDGPQAAAAFLRTFGRDAIAKARGEATTEKEMP